MSNSPARLAARPPTCDNIFVHSSRRNATPTHARRTVVMKLRVWTTSAVCLVAAFGLALVAPGSQVRAGGRDEDKKEEKQPPKAGTFKPIKIEGNLDANDPKD